MVRHSQDQVDARSDFPDLSFSLASSFLLDFAIIADSPTQRAHAEDNKWCCASGNHVVNSADYSDLEREDDKDYNTSKKEKERDQESIS